MSIQFTPEKIVSEDIRAAVEPEIEKVTEKFLTIYKKNKSLGIPAPMADQFMKDGGLHLLDSTNIFFSTGQTAGKELLNRHGKELLQAGIKCYKSQLEDLLNFLGEIGVPWGRIFGGTFLPKRKIEQIANQAYLAGLKKGAGLLSVLLVAGVGLWAAVRNKPENV